MLVEAGGVRPRRGRRLNGRCLSFVEREEIALARAAGESMRSIADRLGRSVSTISRELKRNLDRQGRPDWDAVRCERLAAWILDRSRCSLPT